MDTGASFAIAGGFVFIAWAVVFMFVGAIRDLNGRKKNKR